MNDKLNYREKLASDSSLKAAIDNLVNYIISEKKFRFIKEELKFDISELESNDILKIDEQHLEITNSSQFFYQFYLHYCDQFSFSITSNIEAAFSFIESIDEEFNTLGYNAGISSFFKHFSSFILILLHDEFELDFNEYVLTLNKENSGQRLYDFCNYYCGILSYLKTDIKIIYENLDHLMVEVTDETVRFNGNISGIRRNVISYCKSNPEKGLLLIAYAQERNFKNDNLNSAIIQGIYDVKRSDYWENIESIAKILDYRLSVILSLSAAKAETDIEAEKYLTLINSFIDLTEPELYNLPQFLQSLINNYVASSEVKKICFLKFEELIGNSNQNVRKAALWEISLIKGFDNEKTEIVKKLIKITDFDKEQISLIASIFENSKSLNGFIEIIHLYASKYKLNFNTDIFSLVLNRFYTEQPENLSIELIKLLTHDLGEIRFIGSRILNHLSLYKEHFTFQTDLLQLDALTQYKLWLSILGEMKEPRQSIPILLPLLQSSFPFVKETFICKIEQLTEDYGNSVIETLEVELDLTIHENVRIVNRIKTYADSFWKEISKKRNVRELNPLYTQSELYTLHSTNYGKSFNKSFSENVDKHSVLAQFATTVILAKGGGWKHEKHSKVEKLGTVSTSFQFPRSYFISPESYDWNFRMQYLENWKNILKEWEVIISSLESF